MQNDLVGGILDFIEIFAQLENHWFRKVGKNTNFERKLKYLFPSIRKKRLKNLIKEITRYFTNQSLIVSHDLIFPVLRHNYLETLLENILYSG